MKLPLPRWLRRLMNPAKKQKPPLPDNPYRRFYTKNHSFEELTRRKMGKK